MDPTNTPRFASPEVVSAILRSDDTGHDALYPCQIGVFCDNCGIVVQRDFLVNDRTTKPERLELIRAIARTQGWSCENGEDLCPSCAAEEENA